MFFDILSHVFPEVDQLQSASEVFEKNCRLYRALSNEEVSENLKVAIVHKNLQDAELRKHWLRSTATLDNQRRGHQLQMRGSCGAENCAHGRRSGEPKGKGKEGKGKKGKGKNEKAKGEGGSSGGASSATRERQFQVQLSSESHRRYEEERLQELIVDRQRHAGDSGRNSSRARVE